MLALVILSCSLAADATAVSIAASVRGGTLSRGLLMAFCFGAAQSIMAAIGWAGGAAVGALWSAWDHWLALGLLTIVGVKMIREAFEEEEERQPVVRGLGTLLLLTIATSIDSLAVGVTLPALGTPMVLSLAMIGAVTFLFSAAGAAFGRFLGERFGRVIEVAGGVGLIAIGIRIVLEHTA
ncbi:MAG TPA: manganese efflux pump [Thermoanaerobaculia bacterium]|nr:manganese efflux pump [Thermoanaerobaculia bacterium]